MTEETRLKEIAERAEKASPGPWESKECGKSPGSEYWDVRGPSPFKAFAGPETILMMKWPCHSGEELTQAEKLTEDTAAFIANSREDIPFLLSLLKTKEAELEAARKREVDLASRVSFGYKLAEQAESLVKSLTEALEKAQTWIEKMGHADCARDMDWHQGPECDLPGAKHPRSKCSCGYEELLAALKERKP